MVFAGGLLTAKPQVKASFRMENTTENGVITIKMVP